MICKALITFSRSSSIDTQADLGEKLGDIGLGLLRIGLGKTFTVEKISSTPNQLSFVQKAYSTSVKVAALALFILAIPVTLPLAVIGYVGVTYSKSQESVLNSYYQNEQRNKAATVLQKHVRGYLTRKSHLPSRLYSQYRTQCLKTRSPWSYLIPLAIGGKTRVYLPQEMPEVVLKESGRKAAITRFHQMQKVRSILEAQKSSHLTIPKASLYHDFLIEQRLPINADSYHNMGLYLSHSELFNEAVRELTRLFSKVYLSDLVSHQLNPLGHIAGVEDDVRYDNLPFYIVEEKGKKIGKIGLIDLEHLENSPNSQALQTLVRIFPLHLDTIIEEAYKLKMNVNEASLKACAAKGKKYLQAGFTDHLEWLKQNGFSKCISPLFWQMSTQRAKELTTLLETELLKLNQGKNELFFNKGFSGDLPQRNFLTENPKAMAQELAKSCLPLIFDNLKAQIEEHQSNQLRKLSSQNMTESQLVSFRSPILKRSKLHERVCTLILNHEKIRFEKIAFMEASDIAEQLAYVLMKELVRGGEIFYFDPAYYTSNYELCWVRY